MIVTRERMRVLFFAFSKWWMNTRLIKLVSKKFFLSSWSCLKFCRVLHRCEESYTWPRGHSLTGGLIVAFANTYIHTLLRLPSTGLFSHNVNYYIILVIKKRKENLFTVVQLNSKYIQNYSKYIQNYFVWNILLKSLRLKLSISLVFLILSGSPFHSFGPRK